MNRVIICGRTTADTNVQMTTTGKKVCKFTLAIDDGKDRDGNRRTQYIDCEAWEKTAEFMERYVTKGLRILVEGKLNKKPYEKDGVKHYPTIVLCDRIEFADATNANQNGRNIVPQQEVAQKAQNGFLGTNGFSDVSGEITILPDDLPF